MEGGLPMLNCVLQQTLRSLCYNPCDSSSTSSKWVYAVFWKILPRNYPPPKWDFGGGPLDCSTGNKRNWILVWEDGFCDFCECEKGGSKKRFVHVFFKLSHEVYSFGEGLVGKVAADNSHKWVFRDSPTEKDPNFHSPWNVSIDPQPRAWQNQFHSGIQTIALISVREGLIQLGSFEKIDEDLNLVINIQRKFSYLLSLPGFYPTQRPLLQYKKNEINFNLSPKPQLTGLKRIFNDNSDEFPFKSLNLGYNSPQNGPPFCHIPPLFPSVHCSFGALLSKSPFEGIDIRDVDGDKCAKEREKVDFHIKKEVFGVIGDGKIEGEYKQDRLNTDLSLLKSLGRMSEEKINGRD